MTSVVHFKFKSALAYDSVVFDGAYITARELKVLIADKKGLGRDASYELSLVDPHSGEEFHNNAQLPRNSSVIVSRRPGARPDALVGVTPAAATAAGPAEPSGAQGDEFGADPYAAMAAQAAAQYEEEQRNISVSLANNAEQTRLQQSLAATAAGLLPGGPGRGGRGGRGGFGGGRGGFINQGPPPLTYICHRCGQAGHWIQSCPTNQDPDWEMKRTRAPSGIPITKLVKAENGSLVLPGGSTGVLMANEQAFKEAMAGVGLAAPSSAQPAEQQRPAGALQGSSAQEQQPRHQPGGETDDFGFGRAYQVPDSKGLFDDADLATPAAHGGSSFGAAFARAQQQQQQQGRRDGGDSMALALVDNGPSTSYSYYSLEDFTSNLHQLSGTLPRGPIKLLVRAFGDPQPLSKKHFLDLQLEHKLGGSMDQPAGGHAAGPHGGPMMPGRPGFGPGGGGGGRGGGPDGMVPYGGGYGGRRRSRSRSPPRGGPPGRYYPGDAGPRGGYGRGYGPGPGHPHHQYR